MLRSSFELIPIVNGTACSASMWLFIIVVVQLLTLSHRELRHKFKIYKETTGSGNLRKHLYLKHSEDWFSHCDELGIEITSTNKELQSRLANYRQQHVQALKPAFDKSISRQKYTPKAFVDAIVEFIVADNQV